MAAQVSAVVPAAIRLLASKALQFRTLAEFFMLLDQRRQGFVTEVDLLSKLATYDIFLNDQESAELFRTWDADGDGRVSLSDFVAVARERGLEATTSYDASFDKSVVQRPSLPLDMTLAHTATTELGRGGRRLGFSLPPHFSTLDDEGAALTHVRSRVLAKHASPRDAFLHYDRSRGHGGPPYLTLAALRAGLLA